MYGFFFPQICFFSPAKCLFPPNIFLFPPQTIFKHSRHDSHSAWAVLRLKNNSMSSDLSLNFFFGDSKYRTFWATSSSFDNTMKNKSHGGQWHFATRWWHKTIPPYQAPQKNNNQRATALAWSKSTGGSRGGFVFREGKMDFFAFQGGRIEVAFCDQAMEENGTTWSRPSKTQQSTSDQG